MWHVLRLVADPNLFQNEVLPLYFSVFQKELEFHSAIRVAKWFYLQKDNILVDS